MLIDNIVSIGLQMMRQKKVGSIKLFERRWRSHFETTTQVCSNVWVMLSLSPPNFSTYHGTYTSQNHSLLPHQIAKLCNLLHFHVQGEI